MFERRLKIFLSILFVITSVLVLRAAHLQILKRSEWSDQAYSALKRETLIETTRGTLRDAKGNVLAQDVACTDACVDFRALVDPPDDAWVTGIARNWARSRRTDEWRAADSEQRKRILDEEKRHVLDRIKIMWVTLARLGNMPLEEIDELRHDTVRRVVLAKRGMWYRKFQLATKAHAKKYDDEKDDAWWSGWLIDESQDAPQLDDFDMKTAEETEAHPLLKNISPDVQATLDKDRDDFPGLILRPGMTRWYPQGEAACHVVGNLSRVRREDLVEDPNRADPLKKYQYTDLVGRSGLEGLCEPLLRGARGRIERYLGVEGDKSSETLQATPGADVQTTIDIEIQKKTLALFQQADVELQAASFDGQTPSIKRTISMHGGAVLIDLHGGEVRALVSNPTFDPNTFDTDYPKLVTDTLNQALLNRATQYPRETGSTIKPVVGIGAITQGLIKVTEGIECTGFLVMRGRKFAVGRCWVATRFEGLLGTAGVAHHPIPYDAPHRGSFGNADGFLTFTDAIERSCNVYFETVASRLGLDGLSYWMDKFGLGRPTGIGIEEASGMLPDSYRGPSYGREAATWFAGIGQGQISATPLQMANVAATIARDGIWMRPTLLESENSDTLRKRASQRATSSATQPSTKPSSTAWWEVSDRVDLHLSPEAIKAAQDGMYRVVNTRAGSGGVLRGKPGAVVVAGKTGTAQAAWLRTPVLDDAGNQRRDETGKRLWETIQPSTVTKENPLAPWYVGFDADGKNLKHSWIIGYAPADNPQVAFAVMVEYGGGGGGAAAHIARGMLDAAIEQGYLSPDVRPVIQPGDVEASGR